MTWDRMSIRIHNVPNMMLSISRSGDVPAKPTAVLIHGTGDGAHVWTEIAPSINDICNLILVDLRGHGDSDWSASGDYSLRSHVADIIGVLDALSIDPVILVGHSLGGLIGIHVAAAVRNRVRGVLLADVGPQPNVLAQETARENLQQSMRIYQSIKEYENRLLEIQPLMTRTRAAWIARESLRACGNGFQLKVDPAIATKEGDPDTTAELWSLMAHVACPVLIVRGMASAILSREVAQRMRYAFPNGRLVTMPGAGHALMTDNPTEFVAIARTFLKEILMSASAAVSLS
jgi:pimeloyl-ACP methyl ester carboxylesterase